MSENGLLIGWLCVTNVDGKIICQHDMTIFCTFEQSRGNGKGNKNIRKNTLVVLATTVPIEIAKVLIRKCPNHVIILNLYIFYL